MLENNEIKLLWDFPIQTDRKLEHNRPDITIVFKKKRECQLIDIACPGDIRVETKESQKIETYVDLGIEIKRLWKMNKVSIIPVVIGALGTIPKRLEKFMKEIGTDMKIDLLQKSVLLGTARILRRVLLI